MEKKALSKIVLTLLIAGMLTLALDIQTVEAVRTTIIVPDDYPTIQEAIDHANEGDTIYVYAGTYNEDLNIPWYKHVTILGENRQTTILNGSIGGSGGTDHATIERLTILKGIHFSPTYGVTLVNNTIHGRVTLNFESGGHTIVNNTFYDGLSLGGDWGSSIVGNTVYGGISLGPGYRDVGSCYVDILNNTIVGGVNGIHLGHASNHINIQHNTILNASVGIFEDHDNSYAYSPRAPIPYNNIFGNNISSCVTGISFENPFEYSAQWNPSSFSNVSGNSLENNMYGIYIKWVDHITIYHNNFVNNSIQLAVDLYPVYNTNNVYDYGYPSGGNYWSDHTDSDLYSGPNQDLVGMDGIWDHPYTIDANNQDRYPLVKPWPTIPAAVDVDPDTLNLRSRGRWVVAYIELPERYDVSGLDVSTILLNNTIPVDFGVSTLIGDHDKDGVADLMVKFNRTTAESYIYHTQGIRYGLVALKITGRLSDGTPFEGTDIIFVNYGGDVNNDGTINLLDAAMVSAHWYPGPPTGLLGYSASADINNDGLINIQDSGIVSNNWGQIVP